MALLVVGTLGACASTPETFVASTSGAAGTFGPAQRVAFSAARAKLAASDVEGARRELTALVANDPGELEAATWLQDVELALLVEARRGTPPEDEVLARLARDPDPEAALRRRYVRLAEEQPSVAHHVLAARLEASPDAALAALDRALALDPGSAWAHYARAHALLTHRGLAARWSLAREALDRALALAPGFLRARRLRAWMLAEEGQRGPALAALDAWLAASDGDPRVDDATRVEARLDRALLLVLEGRPERAVRELEALEGEGVGRTRRLALLTVAELERGEVERALAASLRGAGAERGSVLPLVQRALLLERFQEDPEGAEALWRAIAEREDDTSELGDLVQALRARVRLERREAAEGAAPR